MKLVYLLLALLVSFSASCSMGLTGDNGLEVSGDEAAGVVTLRLDGSVVRGILADSGNATGEDNWITLAGTGNVTTSASGHIVSINAVTSIGNATFAEDSDKLDGQHGSYYLPASGGNSTYAGDADKLDGQHGSYYLPASGGNSTYAGDADKLDGQHGSYYLPASGGNSTYAGDADKLDGQHGSYYSSAVGFGSGCYAYRATNQSVTYDATLVELDTELYDVANEFNTSTHLFTATNAGYYVVSQGVNFVGVSLKYVESFCYQNTAARGFAYCQAHCSSANGIMANGSACVYLSAGETVGMYVIQNLANPRNLIGALYTFMSIYRIA